MRVDFTTFGAEPPEQSKPDRAAQTNAAKTSAAKTGASGASSSSSSASAVDQARFSFDPARVQSLATQVLAQPEIRQAKVDALQQAIGNGEYSVPASQVADAIVSDLGGGA
ncbi:MAG: flagellar biosynthesis anti-sigma factor FlgM [Terriglobales bacterium]